MIEIINFAPNGAGDIWINIILWLVSISSVVGAVVLFTILLKLVTLPFDFMSKWSMRKNSVKMEQMRPELEKLQKQYADNKDMYNQKMMALYKKNGYSMFGSCLPTILTLVFFIIAINGFQSYSGYQNRQYFYDMSVSYNNVAYAGLELDNEIISRKNDGKIDIDKDLLFEKGESKEVGHIPYYKNGNFNFEIVYDIGQPTAQEGGYLLYNLSLYTTNSYVYYTESFIVKDDGILLAQKDDIDWRGDVKYLVREEGLLIKNSPLASKENNNLCMLRNGDEISYDEVMNNEGMTPEKFIKDIQQEKSAQTYRAEQASFLWIKNIWATDSPTAHPIQTDWQTFKTTHGYTANGEYEIGATAYSNLIAKLEYEKTAPNGYFILIILTIGITFLTQIIMSKAQKAQMELQTVNGQGAQTQKMMKWMMPIMMAIFAFMYTAAFSIYIVLSSVISLLTTLLINFLVDKKLQKEQNKKGTEKVRGRIYVAEEQPKEQPKEKAKKNKDDKFAHASGSDFLSGTATKKSHIRGRLK